MYVCGIVFRVFDEDSDSHLDQKEWIKGMSIFLRGNMEEKTKCEYTLQPLTTFGDSKICQIALGSTILMMMATYREMNYFTSSRTP